jgi:cytochrome c-type biogenesis protein
VAEALPLAYAFSAGMVATVNPCGFAMLPAYLSLYLGAHDDGYAARPLVVRLGQALLLGATATAGFVVLFGVVGLIIALGGHALVSLAPVAALAIGVLLIAFGLAMLAGYRLSPGVLWRLRVPAGAGRWGILLFGAGYAVASLGCTLPIFLVVVGSALAAGGVLAGLSMFIAYSLGMGAVLITLTAGAALFKGAVARGLRRLLPYVERISAALLIGAGAYIVSYWLTALRA